MSALLSGEPNLRPLNVDDLPELMEIEHRAYPYPWTIGIFRDCLRVGYCCWCLEAAGHIDGYGVMSVAVGEAHILNLTVRPEMQRQGIGARLMEHFIHVARRHGARVVMLEVRPSNTAAVNLYYKLGFNEMGVRPNYYPADKGREDALLLALELT